MNLRKPKNKLYRNLRQPKNVRYWNPRKPKKLTLEASDGRVARVLCKREKDGDLRKDARVNDFNDVVNRLLDADDEARRRKLHLRTFAVVILDEECGLMEWVNRTHGLRFVMEAAYGLHPDGARRMPGCFDDRIRGPFEQNQRTYANDGVAMAREYRKIVLGQYEPCFSRWFAPAPETTSGTAPSGKTSNLSISVKSKSFRLIFGLIVFSR